MLWLYILLAALVLFLIWAGRRMQRSGGTTPLVKGGERLGDITMGRTVASDREHTRRSRKTKDSD
jgi:flagellar biogenesis protein FliO